MKFIDLGEQYRQLKTRIDHRMMSVLDSGQYIMGPEVSELETKLADYVGVKHTISCANGTDALTLALMALDVRENDAVFVPAFTFFASAEPIAFLKARPVFVDSNINSFNICPVNLEYQIKLTLEDGNLNPKVILAVDLFGLPADYIEIKRIADKYGLKIIEDAAQGFGGKIGSVRAGSFGDIATTSFFPAKPLGCYGDGGAVFTESDEYAELVKSYRVHGKGKDKYNNIKIGMNSRLDTIQAAILLEKLDVFPDELEQRNDLANFYQTNLGRLFKIPLVPHGYSSSWAQYSLQSQYRDSIVSQLNERGIPAMVYYRTCLHRQLAFEYLGYKEGSFPNAELLSRTVFSIPMHPYITEMDRSIVVSAVQEIHENAISSSQKY